MKALLRASFFLSLLFSLLPADWLNHGGNAQRNCIANVNGPSAPTVLWQGTLPSSFGQNVLIWEDKLVTYRDNFTTSILVCHDLETGDTLWTLDFPGSGGRTLPAGMHDGKVYVVNLQNTAPDTLYAYDAADGSLVWRCPCPVSMYLSESATFADDGDLIIPLEGFATARINHLAGDTVWTTPRVWPVSGSADATVGDSHWYCFGGALVGGSLKLYSFDVATGHKLDSVPIEDTHPGGSAPYGNIIVGPDQVLYAHRCGDNVTAVEDSGNSLRIRWVYDVGESLHSPFAQLACGPDSSVYALAHGRIIRLDPATGTPRDSSPYIKDPAAVFAVHMAIGADGTVYATNGGYSRGALYAFTPDLRVLWVESIPNVSTSNPAVGPGGELAIAGSGTDLRVYRDAQAAGERATLCARRMTLDIRPNPCAGTAVLHLATGPLDHSTTPPRVYDASGRLVRHCSLQPGNRSLALDLRGLSTGTYFIRLGSQTTAVVLTN
jgi:outer membrane protein assembly factor BamB